MNVLQRFYEIVVPSTLLQNGCFEVRNPISQHAAWDALTSFLVRANLGTPANKNASMIHPSGQAHGRGCAAERRSRMTSLCRSQDLIGERQLMQDCCARTSSQVSMQLRQQGAPQHGSCTASSKRFKHIWHFRSSGTAISPRYLQHAPASGSLMKRTQLVRSIATGALSI